MSDNAPASLIVVYRRDTYGAVASLELWYDDGSEMVLDTAADEDPDAALSYLLHLARDYYRADPHDDALPPDHAVIAAYEYHLA